MQHQYPNEIVTPWGGMKEMKQLIDRQGLAKSYQSLDYRKVKATIA